MRLCRGIGALGKYCRGLGVPHGTAVLFGGESKARPRFCCIPSSVYGLCGDCIGILQYRGNSGL